MNEQKEEGNKQGEKRRMNRKWRGEKHRGMREGHIEKGGRI